MPNKQKRTEQEIHDSIVKEARYRLGCSDFAPEFTLHATHDPLANWDVEGTRNSGAWKADCAQLSRRPSTEHAASLTLRGRRSL